MHYCDLEYLRRGSRVQQEALQCLESWHIMQILAPYSPILCGTVPLGIHLPDSDLDIICNVADFSLFAQLLTRHFADLPGFSIKRHPTLSPPALTASFRTPRFPIEIFGQSLPVREQHAYRHMVQEARILAYADTTFRSEIVSLKLAGFSTEEAFAQKLGIANDPYEALLRLEECEDEELQQRLSQQS